MTAVHAQQGHDPASLIGAWKTQWSAKLEQSRPHWLRHARLPIACNPAAPSAANDPDEHIVIEVPPIRIIRLVLPTVDEDRAVSREELGSARAAASILTHERASNYLLADPGNGDLCVLINRWPKIKYHSLLVSNIGRCQKLTEEDVVAQLQWARMGVLSEFHRAERFVNHFHAHLFPQDATPLGQWSPTFSACATVGAVAMGALAYPFCHIAFSSSQGRALAQTATAFATYLDENEIWYNQDVLATPDGDEMIVAFFLWTKQQRPFGFVTAGFVSCDYAATVPSPATLRRLSKAWFDRTATAQARRWFSQSGGRPRPPVCS